MSLLLRAGFVLALSMLPGAQAQPVQDILSQAGQYVEEFKRGFKVVISDERYEQRLRRTEDRDQKLIR